MCPKTAHLAVMSCLPDTQAQQLRAKIVAQDTYDLAGYKQLLDDLRGQSASQDVCAAYEELVAAFPTAVRGELWRKTGTTGTRVHSCACFECWRCGRTEVACLHRLLDKGVALPRSVAQQSGTGCQQSPALLCTAPHMQQQQQHQRVQASIQLITASVL